MLKSSCYVSAEQERRSGELKSSSKLDLNSIELVLVHTKKLIYTKCMREWIYSSKWIKGTKKILKIFVDLF